MLWRARRRRSHRRDGRAVRGIALLIGLTFPCLAGAQVSGTLTAVSDYRYRGISLSDKKPAAQIGATYDHSSGWYIGAFGSTVELIQAGASTEAVGYTGFAARLSSGLSVDVGGSYSAFDDGARYNYQEFYIGLASEDSSARIYYSPKYFGLRTQSLYFDLNHARPLIDKLRAFAHVGFLYANHDSFYATGADRRIFDARIGLGVDFEFLNAELAWVGVSRPDAASRLTLGRSSNTVVLTLSRAF